MIDYSLTYFADTNLVLSSLFSLYRGGNYRSRSKYYVNLESMCDDY